MTFQFGKKAALLGLSVLMVGHEALAVRVTGGRCVSQGSWLQAALEQSDTITNTIEALRNDPNCKLLIDAVGRAPKFEGGSSEKAGSGDTTSFASFYNELNSIADVMRPNSKSLGGLSKEAYQKIVYNVVFNKSFQAVKELNKEPEFAELSQDAQKSIGLVSLRLKNFLHKSKDIAKMTMATAQTILDVLPQSKLCMHERPSTMAAFFSAFTHSAAALVTGGEINNVGEFLSKLMNFTREMKYVNALTPMEVERFNASVSCLVESTSESYCALQDAENALDFVKGKTNEQKSQLMKSTLANQNLDPIANPLGGLIIFMRDVPTTQNWMQKVLFGIDPRPSLEAEVKNSYWTSFNEFIKSLSSVPANFRDRERTYRDQTNLSDDGKLAQIKDIVFGVYQDMVSRKGADINFYTMNRTSESIFFYLIGTEIPADFSQANNFNVLWSKWSQSKERGFNNPDRMLQTVKERYQLLMEEAKRSASSFFAKRMIVDPQNLLSQAFNGPGVSPFQAFVHLRNYYTNLAKKLERSAVRLHGRQDAELHVEALRGQLPMLRDSVARLDKVIDALKSVKNSDSADVDDRNVQSQKIMDVVYEAMNMLTSRDSFLGTRMQTALQADLSDTLWSQTTLTEEQSQLLLSLGSDIVTKLSGYFTNDPVFQRTDISAAKPVHISNLKAAEELFAKVIFKQLTDIGCKLEGGAFCSLRNRDIDPTKTGAFVGTPMESINREIVQSRADQAGKFAGLFYKVVNKFNPPTEDAQAYSDLKGKLCMQVLAFESREAFVEVCRGARLESEYTHIAADSNLNASFDDMLAQIKSVKLSSEARRFDNARGLGVCAFRSYLRKNEVFRMYQDYSKAQ